MPEINNYNTIADLYDTFVPVTYDIPFFLNEAKKTSGEVLELMAGTGRVSIPLIEAGVRLTCVDKYPGMLTILQQKLIQKGLTADLHVMDICELNLGKQFDQVIIPFNSFSHLLSLESQRQALERIYNHLTPGGTFICILGNPTQRRKTVDGILHLGYRFPLVNGQLLLWMLEKYNSIDPHVVELVEFFEQYDEQGILQSKRIFELNYRLTSKSEFENLANSVSFYAATVYGDYEYGEFHEDSSPNIIWLLKKTYI